MHVMFMAMCYAPEEVSGGVLVTELAEDLARRGHQVTVVTVAPNYPCGRVFAGYKNAIFSSEMRNGVRVVRVWSYIAPGKKVMPRLLFYGTFSISALYGGLFAGRPDVLMCYLPPLPLGLTGWLLARFWGVPWVLQIEDMYPDAAIAAGYLTNCKLIRFFFALERFLYKQADRVSVISANFRQALLKKNVPDSKIELIPVWADPEGVYPMPRENGFRQSLNLQDKFVVLYAGNLGLTSCLEDVIDSADLLRNRSDIEFVLVGEGVKKQALEEAARQKKLSNLMFLPFQPREHFPEMLAAADASLVTINEGAACSSLPSKVFNIMASARPVLSVAPLGCELAHIVEEAGCGWNVPPHSPQRLAEVISQIFVCQDVLTQRGQNGRAYFLAHYTRAHCVDAHERMLLSLLPYGRVSDSEVRE